MSPTDSPEETRASKRVRLACSNCRYISASTLTHRRRISQLILTIALDEKRFDVPENAQRVHFVRSFHSPASTFTVVALTRARFKHLMILMARAAIRYVPLKKKNPKSIKI